MLTIESLCQFYLFENKTALLKKSNRYICAMEYKYNFDEVIDRRGTNAYKTDAMKMKIGREGLIPLWVADMDFKAPPPIIEAFRKRIDHGIFGYTIPSKNYYDAIINWLSSQHGWSVSREELSYIPGIVKGIGLAIDHFTNEGDKIIIQPPVYHPFRLVPQAQNRTVVENPLLFDGENYTMDLGGLKKIVSEQQCKILILCNPHNPVGIAWSREVLQEVAEICAAHNVLVISDEIHAEILHNGYKHTPFATVSEKAAQHSITFMAPSKTFNLAGIVCSYAVIKNHDLRKSYYNYLKRAELDQGTLFSYLATEVAYTLCDDWRKEMTAYVCGNIQFVAGYLEKNIPQIKALIPQASFLVWLDCSGLQLDHKALVSLFRDQAGLALNDGATFGTQGAGFMRLNVGCPRSTLEKALRQLKEAVG